MVTLVLCPTCHVALKFSLIVAASAHQLYPAVTGAEAFCDFVIQSLLAIGCLSKRHLCFDIDHALIIVKDICFGLARSQSMLLGVVDYIHS